MGPYSLIIIFSNDLSRLNQTIQYYKFLFVDEKYAKQLFEGRGRGGEGGGDLKGREKKKKRRKENIKRNGIEQLEIDET